MKKQMLKLFLTVAMVVTLMSVISVTAAAADYNLWVCGVQVTSENCDKITEAIPAEMGTVTGEITYDPDTEILTLKNADIDVAGGGIQGIKVESMALTLNLVGNNKVTNDSGSNAIYVGRYGSLTINGSGSLTAKNSADSSSCIRSRGLLVIQSGTVTATATGNNADGILAQNGVTISGGKVTAKGVDENGNTVSDGIDANGTDINISGGEVEAIGRCGIYTDSGTVNISGGTVTATGNGGDYYGIFCSYINISQVDPSVKTLVIVTNNSSGPGLFSENNTTISGGTVIARGSYGIRANRGGCVAISGGTVTATGRNYGIYATASSNVTISDGTVTATGSECGIHAGANVTIEGGTVTATGSERGIYAANITISGGTVTAKGSSSFGIYSGTSNVKISGDTVTASGSPAINCNPDVTDIPATHKIFVASNMNGVDAAAWDNNTSLNTYQYINIAEPHYHNWTYASNDNVITATCDGAGICSATENTVTITLEAPDNLIYNGTAKIATATSSDPDELQAPEITYSGPVTGDQAIDAGTYTASITMGGKTATVEFVIAPKPEAAPDDEDYTIHYAEETITAAEDCSLSTADDEDADAVNSLRVTPGTTVYVRKNASDNNHAPSDWVAVDIPARPAAPAAQGVNETMAGKEDGKITGVDATMEYSADGSTWTPCTGTEITDLASGTYYVRVKGTASSFVGTQAEVVINAGDQLTVTFNSNEGSAVASANVNYGAKVTKPADPTREDYTFSGWYTSTDGEGVEFNFDSVVTTNITLYAKWTENSGGNSGISSDSSSDSSDSYMPTYTVEVEKSKNGEIKMRRSYAFSDDTVTITAIPKEGYVVDTVSVTDSRGNEIELTDKGDGIYTFKMPSRKVTVSAVFVPDGSYISCIGDSSCTMYGYTDLDCGAWYHDGVHYAIDKGLMSGYGNNIFKPNGTVTRQQVWMMLARMSGEEPANMTAAREWAVENNVSDGTNPTAYITRQQYVAMLWRWAAAEGMDVSAGEETNILSFTDANKIGDYAVEAFQWACSKGIVGGYDDGSLRALANASRAHAAAMMMRFCASAMK